MAGTPAEGAEPQRCAWCSTERVLLTSCPSCGVLPLCVGCIVGQIADICEQEGRTLGP
jgi:hypothetical protein